MFIDGFLLDRLCFKLSVDHSYCRTTEVREMVKPFAQVYVAGKCRKVDLAHRLAIDFEPLFTSAILLVKKLKNAEKLRK